MINCLNSMKIPYSVVIFADYQFIYTIKKFEMEYNDTIYKMILDCIMVPRYSSRIANACYYIDKTVIHPKITNRRIFIISNGLDSKLKSPENCAPYFWNEKDKYVCFKIINKLKILKLCIILFDKHLYIGDNQEIFLFNSDLKKFIKRKNYLFFI